MLRTVTALAFALAITACGTSPQAACKEVVATNCDKTFTCFTGAEVETIKLVYGSNAAECKTKFEAASRCTNENPCEAGKTYDAVQATACINAYKAASCDALKAGSANLSACDTVCK